MFCSYDNNYLRCPQEELGQEKQRLVDFFTTGPGSANPPNSLYLHPFSRKLVYIQWGNPSNLMGHSNVSILVIQGLTIAVLKEMEMVHISG